MIERTAMSEPIITRAKIGKRSTVSVRKATVNGTVDSSGMACEDGIVFIATPDKVGVSIKALSCSRNDHDMYLPHGIGAEILSTYEDFFIEVVFLYEKDGPHMRTSMRISHPKSTYVIVE